MIEIKSRNGLKEWIDWYEKLRQFYNKKDAITVMYCNHLEFEERKEDLLKQTNDKKGAEY